MPSQYSFENDLGAVRDLANQWLAKFAPLISSDEVPYETDTIRHQMSTIAGLKSDAPELLRMLQSLPEDADQRLRQTIVEAINQLDSIEQPLRKQLAKVAPGDPLGVVDVESLQERLAERQAKQEIGVSETSSVPAILEVETSPPNKAIAIGAGIFGLGWTAFTTIHCVFMIGGMYHAFGIAALGLLLFYSIFFMVGFAMLGSSLNSMSTESISLNGRTLIVYRKLGNWTRTKTYQLATDTQASIGKPQAGTSQSSEGSVPLQTINLTDNRGKGVSIGASTTSEYKQKLSKKINEYLAVWG
ncbi:MAG: hypothetical protein WCI55_10915 [Armatimonadota bacterium]